MDPARWQHVRSLFLDALELPIAERQAFVDAALDVTGGDDNAVREELQALLDAHGDSHALDIETTLPSPDDLVGQRLGPHRLLRRLGRGGMGEVYLAERDDDTYRRRVAIKIVRPGFGSDDLAARFRTERQILAQLDHPNIASLLDGGVTEDGRPYLVMQYVDGEPITDHCRRLGLDVEQRLRLFLQVVEAVRFAHLHLVVHRDLKPSNILVTEDGVVQLLDFGIAKLLDPTSLEVTAAMTRSEVRVMTPHYAAPEQFLGQHITTVTDVYALGVLLYELLTGRRPYELTERSPTEVERLVCHELPARPSTAVLSSFDGDPPTLPGSGKGLAKQLRGDLDNIVLMALRKEPERRYASAQALGDDLQRTLDGLPVAARPDTWSYRTGKFVRRHRWGVAAASLVAVLLLSFGVVMAWQASHLAQRAEELALERDRVRLQAEKTDQVKTLVSDLFKVLDPNDSGGKPSERLREASGRIIEELEGQPDLQAELMDEVVTIYINLGLYDDALSMAQNILELSRDASRDESGLAQALYRMGETLYLKSRFDDAQVHYEQALTLQRRLVGDLHPDVARSQLALSRLHRSTQRYEEAAASAQEAESIYRHVHGQTHGETAEAMLYLAIATFHLGEPEAAEDLLQQVVHTQRQVHGDDHPKVAWTLTSMAHQRMMLEKFNDAEPLLREALQILGERYRDDHPDTTRTLQAMGHVQVKQGDLQAAEATYRRVVEARSRHLGDTHTATVTARARLGRVFWRQGRYEEAEDLLLGALEARRGLYQPGHGLVKLSLRYMVELYDTWKRPERSRIYQRELDALQGVTAAAGGSTVPTS